LKSGNGIDDVIWLEIRLKLSVVAYVKDTFCGLGISSQLLTRDLSFLVNDKFKPFAGLGFGSSIYKNSDKNDNNKTRSVIGFCPRLRFEFGHFSMVYKFNLIKENVSNSPI
jgi:hypothetical protein